MHQHQVQVGFFVSERALRSKRASGIGLGVFVVVHACVIGAGFKYISSCLVMIDEMTWGWIDRYLCMCILDEMRVMDELK